MTEVIVRPSVEADIEAIFEIYEHEVLHGMATFDENPPSRSELLRKRAGILEQGFPHLVAEVEGKVVAYSYISLYRQRSAYNKTVENAIYVRPFYQGRGIAYKLMIEIIEKSQKIGIRNIIAVIGDSDNLASIRLHKKLGFRKVGTLREVGFKFGRWIDVVLMQKVL